jgi:signal transduction histidine kinase
MKKFLDSGDGPVLNKRIEVPGLHKAGHELPLELTIFPYQYKGKHYFTAFARDISELKTSRENMEKALERQKELNTLKSQFISTTSHELKTPLTTIQSNTEIINYLLENAPTLDRVKLQKNIDRIANNVERLGQLIDNILMIGRLESKKFPFNPEPHDLNKLIISRIIPNLGNRKPGYKVEGKPKMITVDANLFTHILNNLIENAFKYSVGAKTPGLFMEYLEHSVRISVKDYGIGIPKADQEKLFESFYRASNVDNIQGTGLGLSIVKDFVELHRGTIAVKSEQNQGTTFTLTFPI